MISRLLPTIRALVIPAAVFLFQAAWAADLDKVVRETASKLIDPEHNVGVAVVVGVTDRGTRHVFAYGEAKPHSGRQPNGKAIFEIGSITKTFVATVLAGMVLEGEITLDTPVKACLPDGANVPECADRNITLLHLTTHTSGLPRNPPNMWSWRDLGALDGLFNPFPYYTEDKLFDFLGGYKLQTAPGESYGYSNLGAGLLGHALSLKAGSSFETLIVDRICNPLEMDDTRVVLTQEQRRRVCPGYIQVAKAPYTANPYPSSYVPVPTLGGAGSLRSTVDDMLAYLEANLGLIETDPDLSKAIEMTHKPRFTINDHARMGLGWKILDYDNLDEPIFRHSGLTGGYCSFAGFVKKRELGVVVLHNTLQSVNSTGLRILSRLAKECNEAGATANQ